MRRDPADFRDRLRRAIDAGLARAGAATYFGASERTIPRWQQRPCQTGTRAPRHRRGRPRRIGAAEPALQTQVAATPDATLSRHCARWQATHGTAVSPSTMSSVLMRLGLPVKTNAGRRRPRSGRTGGPAGRGGGA